ncbi:hypothetical protein B0J14DRAFT_573384, partial [Halenospora varia]
MALFRGAFISFAHNAVCLSATQAFRCYCDFIVMQAIPNTVIVSTITCDPTDRWFYNSGNDTENAVINQDTTIETR